MTDRMKRLMLATTIAAATAVGAGSAGAVTFQQARQYSPGIGFNAYVNGSGGHDYGPGVYAYGSVAAQPSYGPQVYSHAQSPNWYGGDWQDLGYGRVLKID